MIYNYKQFSNIDNKNICPFCLNNYLNMVKEERLIENFGYTQNEENDILMGAKFRSHPNFLDKKELPKENVNVRSMSILVPTGPCVNACKFCCSKISQLKDKDKYIDLSNSDSFYDMYFNQFERVSKMGCEFAILTGTGEPIQNKKFLRMIGNMNKKLEKPFKLEIQTSGVMLNDSNLDFLKNEVGVYLISLSASNIFDDISNANVINMRPKLRFNLKDLCNRIKSKGFILRLSLNLINIYDNYSPKEVIDRLKELKVDQATFRALWAGKEDNEISKWIRNNKATQEFLEDVEIYCSTIGKKLNAQYPKYQVNNMTIVIDEDCMSEKEIGQIRYLILRSDCKLYTKWDTASSVFK